MTTEAPDTTSRQASTAKPDPGSTAPRGLGAKIPFLACCVLLIILAVGFQVAAAKLGLSPKPKLPAPLRKPLSQLDASELAPYELIEASDIKAEVLDALGTHEYIQWTLRDNTPVGPDAPPANAPERIIQLFVTYYTDTPGQVPHVPEECYLGGGYSQDSQQVIDVAIPELQQTIPAKVLTFERPAFLSRDSRVVVYTFSANGRFAAERQVVRTLVNNPRETHAYFSKVEVSFGAQQYSPTPDKAIDASKRFLAKVIPVLVKEHWPNWAEVEAKTQKQ